METSLDCIPCFLRQTLSAASLVSEDRTVHERILRDVLKWCSEMDLKKPAPFMAQRIHRRLRDLLDSDDPYKEIKRSQNAMALSLLDYLESILDEAKDRLLAASKLAIAGNVIDLGVSDNVEQKDILFAIEESMKVEVLGDFQGFRAAIDDAKMILYLTDNAGEIVFDSLLLRELPRHKLCAAVRGAPVINDATIEDAKAVGLTDLLSVVSNGSDAPATLLEDCSEEFQRLFAKADLIIAKGQGNFESLSDCRKRIFFLFKAKCPVIASSAGVPLGAQVLRKL